MERRAGEDETVRHSIYSVYPVTRAYESLIQCDSCLLRTCPVLHTLGLAFSDGAFDSDDIRSLQNIYDYKIPDFKESTLLKWKKEWIPRPIFRRACTTTNGLITSSIKVLSYQSFAPRIQALGKGAGFRARMTAYTFRRGAAQVVNSKSSNITVIIDTKLIAFIEIVTPAERNQIMGHHHSSIYEQYYQNRVVSTVISADFLKKPSRSLLLVSVGHIGIDRNPRAPL